MTPRVDFRLYQFGRTVKKRRKLRPLRTLIELSLADAFMIQQIVSETP